MPFPETFRAATALFPKKDELRLTNGWSLIKGQNATFFLALEDVRQIIQWTEHGINLNRNLLTQDADNRLLGGLIPAMSMPISGFTPPQFLLPGGAFPQPDLLPNPLAGNAAPGAALLTSVRTLQRPHVDVSPSTNIGPLPSA